MIDSDKEEEMFWPVHGDKIFKNGHGWSSNARVDNHLPSRMSHMIDGYEEVAEVLTEAALEHGNTHHLVYPIVFLYRHSLELTLKNILASGGDYAGELANWKTHEFRQLWKSVLRVFAHFDLDVDDDSLRAVNDCIMEFDSTDRSATVFRYAVDRNGNPLKLEMPRIDLLQVRRVMKSLQTYLECAAAHIEASTWAISESLTG
jgi:hypothetical protein